MVGSENKSKSKWKKGVISSLILFIIVFQILMFVPRPAQALFGVGDITFATTIGDIPRIIWDVLAKITKQVVAVSFKNALRTFTQQIAYDTAVKIASGGEGQGPLFTTKEFTKHITQAGNAAIGDALDTMSTQAWGFSLCDADPAIRLDISAGLALDLGISEPREARCTGSEIFNSLASAQPIQVTGGFGIGIEGQDPAQISAALMQSFPEFFSPEGNNLGQYLKIQSVAVEEKKKAEEKAKEEAEPPGEYLPLKSLITGDTKTPAKTISGVQQFSLEQAINPAGTFTGELAADFIGVFTNTLIKKYMETLLTKGLNPNADTTSEEGLSGFVTGAGSSGIAAAEARFASFTQPNLGGGGSVDILNKLSSCPTKFTDVENCTMDSSFRTAVEQHLRLEEATEKGYIDGNKSFGFGQGGSLLTLENGYSYRNLVIMRRHRIVPVSWELAALYIRDFGAGNYSLNNLMALYDDESSPFYQLIDPDWVLKAPDNYCRRQGYGETKVFNEPFDHDGDPSTQKAYQVQRKETCIDDQSCISENDDGSCQAYGYCIKEDPIWRFAGEECPDYYASCKNYQRRDGEGFSYLEDTVDYNGCTADNVGCQWYCKEYDNINERWRCYYDGPDYGFYEDGFNPWGNQAQNGNQFNGWLAHLDANTQTCDASAEGCHEYIRATNETNLIKNANFDYFTGDPDDSITDTIASWDIEGAAAPEIVTVDTTPPYLGYYAVNLPIGTPTIDNIRYIHVSDKAVGDRTFVFSAYLKSNDSAACQNNATLRISTTLGSEPQTIVATDLSSSWQRYEISRTFSSLVLFNIEGRIGADSGCDILIDSAKLEEITFGKQSIASEFTDYGIINKVYLDKDRATCQPEDVGCQWYTPLAGGDPIPATITSNDICLEEQVGCKAYEETALTNIIPDPTFAARSGKYCTDFPYQSCNIDADCSGANNYCFPSTSIIPSTGDQCSVAFVGCEEYTNLDEVAQGGEGKEYYTFLKQCVPLDDPAIETFYAWEGDDVAGYQLRAFKLKRSQIVYSTETGNAPCTHLETGQNLPLACLDSQTNVQECSAEYGTNPDCVEFFDDQLNTFYRYKSQTITVSANCHPERNSLDNNVYYGLPEESTSCPGSAAGCREYLGSAGYNYREIFNNDFEDGTVQGWAFTVPSSESVMVNGHSVKMDYPIPNNLAVKTLMEANESLVTNQKTYILSLWAKNDNINSVDLQAIMSVDFQGGPAAYIFADTDSLLLLHHKAG